MDFDPVGTVMGWISAYGLLGLFAVALAERFIPVMPSYGLFLAVGIATSVGTWSLPGAFLATTAGSVFGCAAWFYAARRLGHARSTLLLDRAGRLFGVPGDRMERGIASFLRNRAALAFTLQLLPAIRLFAPVFAALLHANARNFLAASAAGIAIWNGVFIGIGFYASHAIDTTNTTMLALSALGFMLMAEAALFWLARRARALRKKGATLCQI